MKTKRQCLEEMAELLDCLAWWNAAKKNQTAHWALFWFTPRFVSVFTPTHIESLKDWMTRNPNWTWGVDQFGLFVEYLGDRGDE